MTKNWILLLVAMAGCTPLDFTTDATAIRVSGQDNADTLVYICAAPGDLLSCNPNEGFVASLGSDQVVPVEGFLSFGSLDAMFDRDVPGSVVTVTRTRDNAAARATMPPSFAGVSSSSSGGRTKLVWAPVGGSMSWTASIGCANDTQPATPADPTTITDTGELDVALGELPTGGGTNPCSAAITLTRTGTATLSGFEAESTVTVEQDLTLSFELDK